MGIDLNYNLVKLGFKHYDETTDNFEYWIYGNKAIEFAMKKTILVYFVPDTKNFEIISCGTYKIHQRATKISCLTLVKKLLKEMESK
jgi:hypothetical protein